MYLGGARVATDNREGNAKALHVQMLKARNKQSWRSSPPGPNEIFETVEVLASRLPNGGVPKKKGKNAKIDSCLLIGFDTEYQSVGPLGRDDLKSEGAQNEILSYQFSVKLVATDPSSSSSIAPTEGIILPDPGERMKMGDFVVGAIGTFLKANPEVPVPETIYLVGHFTRSDLPAFSDFGSSAKAYFSNIRNTFVTGREIVKVQLDDEAGNPTGMLKFMIRDTMLLAPNGVKKLEDLGSIVGLEKLKLAGDGDTEAAVKRDMKALYQSNWPLFRSYAVRDAEICVRYSERVIRQYQAMFELPILPVTMSKFLGRKKCSRCGRNKDAIRWRCWVVKISKQLNLSPH